MSFFLSLIIPIVDGAGSPRSTGTRRSINGNFCIRKWFAGSEPVASRTSPCSTTPSACGASARRGTPRFPRSRAFPPDPFRRFRHALGGAGTRPFGGVRMNGCQTTRLLKNLHRLPEIVGAYRHAGDWLDLSLRYLGMASPSFPYDVRLRDGVRFRFESTEEIRVFWNIFFRPTYHVGPDTRLILTARR